MANAGSWAARLGEVAVSNAASSDVTTATYVAIEKANNPRLSGTLDTAESSSNDSGGSKEFVPTWESAQLTFEMIADEDKAGQEHLWTAYLSKEVRAFRCDPRGGASGDKRLRFLGIVTSIEEALDKGDVAKYNVTITKTGAITRDATP